MIKLWSKYKGIGLLMVLIVSSCLITLIRNRSYVEITHQDDNEWEQHTLTTLPKLEETTQEIEIIKEKVPVYICGEINNPGVYYVKEETIIDELVELAGGFTVEADQINVNLAQSIKKSEKIYVPKIGEKIDKTVNSYENVEYENELININVANVSELDSLPGIGQSRAEQIITYRENNGTFLQIEDIKNVPGIGDKIYESLKELIRIE